MIEVHLYNDNKDETNIGIENMYMLRPSTVKATVLIQLDEFGSKAGFLFENWIIQSFVLLYTYFRTS